MKCCVLLAWVCKALSRGITRGSTNSASSWSLCSLPWSLIRLDSLGRNGSLETSKWCWLRFLRQELPAVPSCRFWVNRSELYLDSPSLTIPQKQLPRLHRFNLTHQMVNISDRRNINIGRWATQCCRPCHSRKCVWKHRLKSHRLRTMGGYPRTVHSPHAAFHRHPAHPNSHGLLD